VGLFFAYPVGWYIRLNSLSKAPSDAFSKALADKLVNEGRERESLTEGIYLPENTQEALGRLEHAFRLSCQADLVAAKVKQALRSKVLQKGESLYEDALALGVIDEAEYALLREAKKVKEEAIMVDAFSVSDYLKRA
jgi:acyl-CoA dehydrogenase